MNPNAFEFKPSFTPTNIPQTQAKPEPAAPVDKITQKLTALKQSADDITAFKSVLKELQADKKSRGENGPISLDLFTKLGALTLCKTSEEGVDNLTHCLNKHIVAREEVETQKSKGGQNKYQKQRTQHNRNRNDGDDNDFSKGQKYGRQNTNWNNHQEFGQWKQEDTAEKAKLKEKAQAMH